MANRHVLVQHELRCSICNRNTPQVWDAPTITGQWAYLCFRCVPEYGAVAIEAPIVTMLVDARPIPTDEL